MDELRVRAEHAIDELVDCLSEAIERDAEHRQLAALVEALRAVRLVQRVADAARPERLVVLPTFSEN